MADILSEAEFTQHFHERLAPFDIPLQTPEPLIVELHYGDNEPVLSIPLKGVYEQYVKEPSQLESLIEPYATEISWTVPEPRYPARQIFEKTVPIMKDVMLEPVTQHGKTTMLEGKEVVLKLPKGPLLIQELVARPEEQLIVQFVLDLDHEPIELHRGDVLNCFPDPAQIATIAVQNLGKRALESGLTTRVFKVQNFQTEPWLVGFRDREFDEYVASLVNVSDVMLALERNLEAKDGLIVIIPSRDQMLASTTVDDQAICEMWLLARHLKSESRYPVSGLIWRFNQGEITAIQTVNLQEEKDEK
ncbi:MAG: hypothetical protein IT514_16315 [Burkholderiales bacterium]|nr:hypothetical protein [Burkholderiales bacterium]